MKYEGELEIISSILNGETTIIEDIYVSWRHDPAGPLYEFKIGPPKMEVFKKELIDGGFIKDKEMWAS